MKLTAKIKLTLSLSLCIGIIAFAVFQLTWALVHPWATASAILTGMMIANAGKIWQLFKRVREGYTL